jgi:hypothetical protein
VVVWALPTGSVTARNRKPSKSDVVHDHIRLRQHQIATVACIGPRIRTRHVKQAGMTIGVETVSGSSGSVQLSPGRCSAKMISDSRPDANRMVLIERVGEYLLPNAPIVTAVVDGPCGSGSMHRRPSY